MGHEMSLPSFHMDSAEALLPPWINRDEVQNDIDDPLVELAPVRSGPQVLMENAVEIYGLQHCTFNINKDVHKGLSHWGEFWKQLKNFEALLHGQQGQRRRRFIWTCVRGSAMGHEAFKLKRWSATLYEPRQTCKY